LPSPRDLEHLDVPAVLRDPGRKQAFVTPMFEHIAPRYDDFTRLFSFGMDARWKGRLMSWLGEQAPAPQHVLDVACGTGDLSFAAAVRVPGATVTGVDVATRSRGAPGSRTPPRADLCGRRLVRTDGGRIKL
jgi:SAM-dependent methyltransferase